MSDQEEISAALQIIAFQLEKVNANWNGQNPDVRSPDETLSLVVDAMELSKAVNICTANIVGLATQKLAGTIAQAMIEDETGGDARATIRRLLAFSGPETSPTSLYWWLITMYNAAKRHGPLLQDQANE